MRSADRTRSRLALVAGAFVNLLALASLLFEIPLANTDVEGYVSRFGLYRLIAALTFGTLGAVLAWARPRNALGWLWIGVGALNAISLFCDGYGLSTAWGQSSLPGAGWVLWFGEWIQFPAYWLLPTLSFLLFPDGHLPSPRWRVVAWASVAAAVLSTVGWALLPASQLDIRSHPAGYVSPSPTWSGAAALQALGGLLGLAAVLAAIASLFLRYRHARDTERSQLRSVAYGAVATVVVLLGSFVEPSPGGWMLALSSLPLPISITIAVLGQRQWVLRELSERLDAATQTDTLAAAVESLATALRVPYAAVYVGEERVAATGTPERSGTPASDGAPAEERPNAACVDGERRNDRGPSEHVPLVYQGQVVGQLEIRLDSGDALTTGSRRTLADVSRQLAAVVHARSLAQDLQRSQEALVRAREEERRRLRHDLHDGLGPTLAGMALQVERSRRLAAEDPAEADRVLEQLAGEIRRAVGDVRTIAQGLGVAELEDHGLEGALRRMADQFTVGGLPVQVDVEVRGGELEGLPAAVEVAVYRIVGEALANAARHANADRCTATVRALDHRLDVTVVDDGVGIPDTVQPGVGLRSMEQRAIELGGTLVVSSRAGESTTVRASIPLPDDGS